MVATPPPFLADLSEDLERVEALIAARLESDVVLVRQVSAHIVSGGGKRLRPALLLLSARLTGASGPAADLLAAAVEFIHTATLLHDDVVDQSEVRRGHPTANATFGNAASVLVGDFLYSRAFQMMVDAGGMGVMRVLADATNTIAEGEVLQLMNCRDASVDVARYLEVIRRKTSKLFEASARLGAVLANAPPDVEMGLATYGMHLGTAFQIIDDVLDYSGDARQIGKSLGDDLAEGKPTLPLILAMRDGEASEAVVVRRAIVEGGRDDFEAVLGAIRRNGALDRARRIAEREADAARAALQPLPDGGAKRSLLELAGFSVSRRH